MPSTAADGRIHVAVGAVQRGDKVLIAFRSAHVHEGGKWEFPGGKVEPGEDVREALRRELHEELGIEAGSAAPLIQIPYDYSDRKVLLDVWSVTEFAGEATGRDGQDLRWVARGELSEYEFPAANRSIVLALQLPSLYLISDLGRFAGRWEFLEALEEALAAGARLIQLRENSLDDGEFAVLAAEVLARSRAHGARVLVNRDPEMARRVGADGIHLSGRRLRQTVDRPLSPPALLAASCHTEQDLHRAEAIGADFVVLSPVQPTNSHPGQAGMGWERFRNLCAETRIPVYALGGMKPGDLGLAVNHGAQGLSMIGGVWSSPSVAAAVRTCQSRS
jgi:8-oxo-dGTP diphosphatase